jgi:hypothetical protein
MTQASELTTALFLGVVLAVLVVFLLAVRRVERAPWITAGLVIVVTMLVPAVLTRAHLLDSYEFPPMPLIMVGVIAALTVVLATSRFGARVASAYSLAALVGFHAFRLPLEFVLHQLFVEGALPEQMTWSGRNFDVVTGVTAIVVALGVRAGVVGRRVVLLWSALGLGLLFNVVAIAILSTPVPFRRFTEGPPVVVPSTWPFVWLATFLVPAALLGHIVVLRALNTARRT